MSSPDTILFEVTFDEKGPHLRLVYCGSEDKVSTWQDNLLCSKRKPNSLSKTWINCDLEWAEHAGFIEREA